METPTSNYPRAADIRAALLTRAEAFSRETGMPRTAIGREALNDTSFLSQVADGRNFTLRSYERVMDWLDTHQPTSS